MPKTASKQHVTQPNRSTSLHEQVETPCIDDHRVNPEEVEVIVASGDT